VNSQGSPTPRHRASIAPQIVLLMLVGMLTSQLVTIAIVLFIPPRPIPAYPASVVAAALQGQNLDRDAQRRLRVTTAARPPEPPKPRAQFDDLAAAHLAMLLRAQPSQVRFYYVRDPRWLEAVKDIWRPERRGPHPRGFGPHGRRAGGPPFFPQGGRPWEFGPQASGVAGPMSMPAHWLTDPNYPFFGDFVAAAASPSGQWTIVRPASDLGLGEWQTRVLLWLGGSALVIGPAGFFFARRITAPLARFAKAARRLGADPNSPPVLLDGPAEVGLAAEAFNEMQTRLKRYIADRTAMFSAISHDLRTPLARIRFKLERSPGPLSASVAHDVEQMEKMISSVLTFIRDGQSARTRRSVDLLSLLEYVADEIVQAGGDVVVEEGADLAVHGDIEALKRLFTNLIGNAVTYGGSAYVSLQREAGEAVVRIQDEGPGLPEGELERVFEPFYRADQARNLDSGGIGLGLAIARSIAREHGGEVHLVTGIVGLQAVVQLPIDAEGDEDRRQRGVRRPISA
jgi:signal transduction histidine kinase